MRAAVALKTFGLVWMLGCGNNGDAMTDAGTDAAIDAAADAATDATTDASEPSSVVPANGWANAIVDSDIAAEIVFEMETFTNVATDPSVVVGAPDGFDLAGSVALGDTGRFVTVDLGEGEEAFDGPGPDIDVREYDLSVGGAPEGYAVSVANEPSGPFTMLGEAFGSQQFDLEGSGLESVRYVRVESTQSVDNIINGLGSPVYPGAEIDAVGAFYPGSAP